VRVVPSYAQWISSSIATRMRSSCRALVINSIRHKLF
jgi:hypothetical protein